MSLIKLENVCVDFPIFSAKGRSFKNQILGLSTGGLLSSAKEGYAVVRSLNNINLDIQSGERVGLVGHNGAGKTTLLRVLNGVYAPSSGKSLIIGMRTSLINISLGIDPEATGRQNIIIRGAMMGISKKEMDQHRESIENFTELEDFLDMPVRTYSSGMQLRLAFAISTVIQPDILIMDEWLSTGDETFKIKADKRMNDLVNKTKIMIIASHSRELILNNCNRVIWLERGEIKMDGDPNLVVNAYFR